MTKKAESKVSSPFFARFLEGQRYLKVKSAIKAGGPHHTMKYPSDNDEGETS